MPAWTAHSTDLNEVSKSLVQALGEMTDVVKTQTVSTGQYAYTYATLADALQMARPILAKHDLAISQSVEADGDEVAIYTTVIHSSGQYITGSPLRLPGGKTAQQTGSAVSYARRYSLMAFLGLASEDDDGAGASVRNTPSASPKKVVKAVRNDSRGQSVESRTAQEKQIREMMVALPKDRVKEVREGFVAEFGCGLSDLDPTRHSEALAWMEAFGN